MAYVAQPRMAHQRVHQPRAEAAPAVGLGHDHVEHQRLVYVIGEHARDGGELAVRVEEGHELVALRDRALHAGEVATLGPPLALVEAPELIELGFAEVVGLNERHRAGGC